MAKKTNRVSMEEIAKFSAWIAKNMEFCRASSTGTVRTRFTRETSIPITPARCRQVLLEFGIASAEEAVSRGKQSVLSRLADALRRVEALEQRVLALEDVTTSPRTQVPTTFH